MSRGGINPAPTERDVDRRLRKLASRWADLDAETKAVIKRLIVP